MHSVGATLSKPNMRWWRWMLAIFLLLTTLIWTGNDLLVALQSDRPSRSIGTTSSGRLEHGKRLPSRGDNFHVYSRFGALLGRTSVHSAVRDSVLDAYAELARTHPDLRFVLGETGWPAGGRFWPASHAPQRSVGGLHGAATLGCWRSDHIAHLAVDPLWLRPGIRRTGSTRCAAHRLRSDRPASGCAGARSASARHPHRAADPGAGVPATVVGRTQRPWTQKPDCRAARSGLGPA